MRLRTTCLSIIMLCSMGAKAQGVEPSVYFSWGTNLLISPGKDITSSPGRTIAFGASMTIGNGWQGKLRLEPALSYTGSAYRTKMAYQVHFVTIRSSFQFDLLLALPQMNGARLRVGPFIGKVRNAKAAYEQGSNNTNVQGADGPRLQAEHFPVMQEAGFVLAYSFTLGRPGRFGLDLIFRQHLMPLVEKDQYFALQFSPEQLVLATNTRASILSVGLYYRFGKPDPE
jgi:hypothetical protein